MTRSAILDTNALSALFEGSPLLATLLDNLEDLYLPVVVIGEYRYGIRRSRLRRQLEPLLDTLIEESRVLGIDLVTATTYAVVRSELREAGRPIPENDVWIAALARQHALPVVSHDTHFDAVADLKRLEW
ncbi:MAG TPA: type II toxin-antitoxin system VapC family toxin [Thermoanaerobaculia bacterium]|nr:type II toxin-antitoxin system VapC family toxin [Thermoanaerobaculia bacterium]